MTAIEPPRLGNPQRLGDSVTMSVQTTVGHDYILEYKDTLSDASWTSLPAVTGDGAQKPLTDPAPAIGQRFYRVRVE